MRDQNGPKWSILVHFGLKRSILVHLVHLGPPTILWPFLSDSAITIARFRPSKQHPKRQLWLENITSHDAKRACFKGSRMLCAVWLSGICKGICGRKRLRYMMDAYTALSTNKGPGVLLSRVVSPTFLSDYSQFRVCMFFSVSICFSVHTFRAEENPLFSRG